MTIKQVVIGTLIGSTIIGVTLHRIKLSKDRQVIPQPVRIAKMAQPKTANRKVTAARSKREPWLNMKRQKTSQPELSSSKLYSEQ